MWPARCRAGSRRAQPSRRAARLLGIGAAADDCRGRRGGPARLAAADDGRCRRGGDRPGRDGRRARSTGRDRRASAFGDPAGAERRERPQRRAVRGVDHRAGAHRRAGGRARRIRGGRDRRRVDRLRAPYGSGRRRRGRGRGGESRWAGTRSERCGAGCCRRWRRPSRTGSRPRSGGSGFIAAFVAGVVYGALTRATRDTATPLAAQDLGALLNALTLPAFGAAFRKPQIERATWDVALYALLSLTVVRMVPSRSRPSVPARALPRSRTWAGSARAAWRRSSSRPSRWRRTSRMRARSSTPRR
jgi:hypothetical protein